MRKIKIKFRCICPERTRWAFKSFHTLITRVRLLRLSMSSGSSFIGVARALVRGDDLRADEALAKHADWAEELKSRHVFTAENAGELLRQEVGAVFAAVLEHAGVFKRTPEGQEAFLRFIQSV